MIDSAAGNDPYRTVALRGILKIFLRVSVAVAAVFAFWVLWVLAPIFATPVAKFWYEPGFEDAVAEALTEIPNYENACIYDDTRHMFVTSIGELDVGRMIEQAMEDKALIPRTHQRDPHFRVYNGRNTFYWSFRESEFHAFWGDRWTLAETGKRLCEAYGNSPAEFRHSFQERNEIAVNEANFCCFAVPGS